LGSTIEAGLCDRSECGPIEKSQQCGGKVKTVASIDDADVLANVLDHLILKHPGLDEVSQAGNRSPRAGLFDHPTPLFYLLKSIGGIRLDPVAEDGHISASFGENQDRSLVV